MRRYERYDKCLCDIPPVERETVNFRHIDARFQNLVRTVLEPPRRHGRVSIRATLDFIFLGSVLKTDLQNSFNHIFIYME